MSGFSTLIKYLRRLPGTAQLFCASFGEDAAFAESLSSPTCPRVVVIRLVLWPYEL